MKKEDINIFGNESYSLVEYLPEEDTYAVVRLCDHKILAKGDNFKDYLYDIIYTMYTGAEFGAGDIILSSDLHGTIYKFE